MRPCGCSRAGGLGLGPLEQNPARLIRVIWVNNNPNSPVAPVPARCSLSGGCAATVGGYCSPKCSSYGLVRTLVNPLLGLLFSKSTVTLLHCSRPLPCCAVPWAQTRKRNQSLRWHRKCRVRSVIQMMLADLRAFHDRAWAIPFYLSDSPFRLPHMVRLGPDQLPQAHQCSHSNSSR